MKRITTAVKGKDSEQGKLWEAVRQEWLQFSLETSGYTSVEELPQLDMGAQMLLTGLLIMADWIASNTNYFPLIDIDDNGWIVPLSIEHKGLGNIAFTGPMDAFLLFYG